MTTIDGHTAAIVIDTGDTSVRITCPHTDDTITGPPESWPACRRDDRDLCGPADCLLATAARDIGVEALTPGYFDHPELVVATIPVRGEFMDGEPWIEPVGQAQDPGPEPEPCWAVLTEVAEERARQDAKWGEQNHRDGTGTPTAELEACLARERCQQMATDGRVTWRHILTEEFWEAMAEADPARLRDELVQVAAVATAWAEAIDRRQAKAGAA